MSVNMPSAIVRRGLFQSLRFELAFVLLAGCALPIFALAVAEAGLPTNEPLALQLVPAIEWISTVPAANSTVGVAVCALVSIAALRRLRFYAGAAVARSIMPVVSIAFALLVAIIGGLRFEYSSKVLIVGYIGILLARFAITAMRSRSRGLFYYLVPGGQVGIVAQMKSAPVMFLDQPSLAGLPDCAIVADLYAEIEPEWERFLAEAAISGRPVYHYKQLWEAETGKVQIEHLSENGFGALVPSFGYQKIKRTIDVGLTILLLPVLVPVIAVCAVAIKLDSEGSVFFRQRRMGFRGQEFEVLKLRTMRECHAGEDRALSITQDADKRVTKIGAFLRKTRLDELPQFVNILKGEMSWIGPRPEAVSLSQWYEAEIPFYRYRHIVRPGISGWAQVNQGHVADVEEVDEKLQYDFYYIKNLSYWLDILIALRTIKVMFSGFGAK